MFSGIPCVAHQPLQKIATVWMNMYESLWKYDPGLWRKARNCWRGTDRIMSIFLGQSAQWAPVSPLVCQGGTTCWDSLPNLSVMNCCCGNIGTVSSWVVLDLCPQSNFVGRCQRRRSCCGCVMKAARFQEVRTIFVPVLVFASSHFWFWAFNLSDSFNFMHGQLAPNDRNADKERTASKSSI